jgi:hypothetical protein
MRIKLSDDSRELILSKLKEEYGSYAEVCRKLELNYFSIKNWSCKKGAISDKQFHTILRALKIPKESLSFEKFQKKQDIIAKQRFQPSPDMTRNLVNKIEKCGYGLPLNEFYKLSFKTLVEFDPDLTKMLFSAGVYHFGAIARLARHLELHEQTCRGYSKTGVRRIPAERVFYLVQLLKIYGLTKVPCLGYEEEPKDSIPEDVIKYFIRYGIKNTSEKTQTRILETYERICNQEEITLNELADLSEEPIEKSTKIGYLKKSAIRHLLRLGLVKRKRDLTKKPMTYKYSPTGRLSPKELSFIVKSHDKIPLEKLQELLDPKLIDGQRSKIFNEIGGYEDFIISTGIDRNFYEKTKLEQSGEVSELIHICIKQMPTPKIEKKVDMFIEHAYAILECLKEKQTSLKELYNCLDRKEGFKVNTQAVLYILKLFEYMKKVSVDDVRSIYCLKNYSN